ncbi:hypothetical protein BCON_0037g00100 [Botryotinia convoluta]|uniref:Uncharacterized protein n=1 Tax=Botryotinia convoluta TaxID=54673 RepID=A0A4Z1ILW9_9HELO|nr:hypothetical protein BCON_0037g00100 [Botryotinia convoluta]
MASNSRPWRTKLLAKVIAPSIIPIVVTMNTVKTQMGIKVDSELPIFVEILGGQRKTPLRSKSER